MPIRIPTDVPAHRPSVGADPTNMGSLMPPRIVKPYTYKGTGFDTLTPHLDEDWERGRGAPMPESRKRKGRARTRKPKPRPAFRPRLGDPRHPDHHRYYKSHARTEPERIDGAIPMPAPPPPPELPRKIRTTPGWQPMTGADIDALLDELG